MQNGPNLAIDDQAKDGEGICLPRFFTLLRDQPTKSVEIQCNAKHRGKKSHLLYLPQRSTAVVFTPRDWLNRDVRQSIFLLAMH